MASNISVLTEHSKASIEAAVASYQGNVLAHIYGDWSYHNSMRVYTSTPFIQTSGHTATSKTLRMLLSTPLGVGLVVQVPCEASSSSFAGGGVPILLLGPTALSLPVGSPAQFSVQIASQTPPTYQWTKDTLDVIGGNASIFLLTNITSADAGTYACTIANSYGTVTSNDAILTVLTSSTGAGSTQLPIINYQQPNIATPLTVNATAGAFSVLQLAVDVASATAVSFRWQKDGVDIIYGTDLGAPSTFVYEQAWGGLANGSVLTLDLRPGAITDAGLYRVICTNVNGSVISAEWTVTVI